VTLFTIQQTVQETGLSADTLRYYERIGLLIPIRDASSRHRRYTPADLVWIGFMTKLRSTGMPLLEVREYLELYLQGDQMLPNRQALLEAHARRVEQQVAELQSSLKTIRQKIDYTKARGKALESAK
jgi:DNA-binding transcriptional MerR regulator